jgi:putative sterol carrier protein
MATLAQTLAPLSAAAVGGYFATADPYEISAALRSADDTELLEAFADGDRRNQAVEGLLGRITEFADPVRLASVEGVVGFELAAPDGVERHVLGFEAGVVTRYDVGTAPAARAILATSLVCFLRLITGDADGALLLLAGDLMISGDESLVLDLGFALVASGATQAAIDPAALDPVAVSVAIKDASTEHLGAVMGGAFRPLVLHEVFGRMPEFLIANKADGVRLAVGFRIGGRADGGTDLYVVRVADGACVVDTDPSEDVARDATLELAGPDFLRLVLGHIHPVRAVLGGGLRVSGDAMKALKFSSMMRIPGSGKGL